MGECRIERTDNKRHSSVSLLSIAAVFLRLGSSAFGGPAAHIALMETELVVRRQWITAEEFLDLLGAANLIPGPSSTELALHIGYKKAGLAGLMTAGVCFISPAAILVSVIAALYTHYGKLPETTAVLYGVKAVMIAIVFQALVRLAKTSLKTSLLRVVAVAVVVLYSLKCNELVLLFGSGLVGALFLFITEKEKRERLIMVCLGLVTGALIGITWFLSSTTTKNVPFSVNALFWYFLKLGSVLYGGGYVLLAFLRTDLCEGFHWINSSQLLDAVAVGQITPGPLFTSATFIGYILAGPLGALVATIGIFLPGFVLVALTGPWIKKIRTSATAAQFLDAVNAAAVALMLVVLCQLSRDAIIDLPSLVIAVVSGLLLVRFKTNSIALMLGGAVVGLLLHPR